MTMPLSTLKVVPNDAPAPQSMPAWVPRAIALLWIGFLGTFVARALWSRLAGFFVLLLISLFLALAIEPGTNRLARRGMSRGLATIIILAAVAVVIAGFATVMGALVADQASQLSDNRDQYVTDVVGFLNDNFGANLDAAEIVDSLDD
ncbi:MAG: AI-2E family transporter, partial [Actinobacteria bacterium]|nr:AI-2E family transporter [Actinomycetota bacterium]